MLSDEEFEILTWKDIFSYEYVRLRRKIVEHVLTIAQIILYFING